MKAMKNIFFGLIGLIMLASIIGLLALPRISTVERSLVMQAPAEVIFNQVNDLKKNAAWTPWKDPTMVVTYGSVFEGKGATSSWVSEKMGSGTMTIAESVPFSAIHVDLDFGGMGTAKVLWTFVSEGENVKVTEVMTSDAGMNPAKRWMSLLTEKMIGSAYEKGLASLKQVSDIRAAEIKVEQATQQAALVPTGEGTPK